MMGRGGQWWGRVRPMGRGGVAGRDGDGEGRGCLGSEPLLTRTALCDLLAKCSLVAHELLVELLVEIVLLRQGGRWGWVDVCMRACEREALVARGGGGAREKRRGEEGARYRSGAHGLRGNGCVGLGRGVTWRSGLQEWGAGVGCAGVGSRSGLCRSGEQKWVV